VTAGGNIAGNDTAKEKHVKQWLKIAASAACMTMALGMVPSAAPAAEPSPGDGPDALVRSVTDQTLSALRGDKDLRSGDRTKIYDLVQTRIAPYFDFPRMAQLALGKNWRQATPQQQEAVAAEFRTLLIYTYASAFSKYRDQTISVNPVRMAPDDKDVVVRTAISQPGGGQQLSIDYNMEKTTDGWKVYDVTIEGIRLVQNYRNSFATEVQNNGIDGLILALQNKNKNLAQAPAK